MSEGIEQVENTNDVKPPTPAKKKRNRKEYMQAYYHKHKTPATCSGCNSVFSCSSSMRLMRHPLPFRTHCRCL